MSHFYFTTPFIALVFSFIGCAGGAYNMATLDKQLGSDAYCQKKVPPIGSTDPARPGQSGSDDYLDYSGPCDGPSVTEQIRKQKRFESFRFGRDYMDEG